MINIIIYSFLLTLLSCSTPPKSFVYRKKLESHPLTRLSSWQWTQNRNLETKVSSTLTDQEEQLLDILKGAHSLFKANNLRPSDISTANIQHVFRYALLTLPREFKVFLNGHIKKIFLVKNLGVSTLTIQLTGEKGSGSGQFISFIDIEVLNQKINDWYTWRESTAFEENSRYTYAPYLSHRNTTVDTSQMVLSYLVAIVLNWNPDYFPSTKEAYFLNPEKYNFLNQSWTLKEDIVTPRKGDLLEDLHYLRYYSKGEPLFSTKEQSDFYREIERTNFVNLFALMGSSKDFIESVANYIYVEKLNHPFSIDFYDNKKLINTYESCWQQVRCQEKRKIIENILEKEIYTIN